MKYQYRKVITVYKFDDNLDKKENLLTMLTSISLFVVLLYLITNLVLANVGYVSQTFLIFEGGSQVFIVTILITILYGMLHSKFSIRKIIYSLIVITIFLIITSFFILLWVPQNILNTGVLYEVRRGTFALFVFTAMILFIVSAIGSLIGFFVADRYQTLNYWFEKREKEELKEDSVRWINDLNDKMSKIEEDGYTKKEENK